MRKQEEQGVTLFEAMIAIFIFSLFLTAISMMYVRGWSSMVKGSQNAFVYRSAVMGFDQMMREIRACQTPIDYPTSGQDWNSLTCKANAFPSGCYSPQITAKVMYVNNLNYELQPVPPTVFTGNSSNSAAKNSFRFDLYVGSQPNPATLTTVGYAVDTTLHALVRFVFTQSSGGKDVDVLQSALVGQGVQAVYFRYFPVLDKSGNTQEEFISAELDTVPSVETANTTNKVSSVMQSRVIFLQKGF